MASETPSSPEGHETLAFVLPRPGNSWFGGRSSPPEGHQLHLADPITGKAEKLDQLKWSAVGSTQYVVAVAPTPRRMCLSYAGDSGLFDPDWTIDIGITVRIVSFAQFYQQLGKDMLAAEQPITDALLGLHIRTRARTALIDALAGIQPQNVQTDLSLEWWESRLRAVAAANGLTIRVETVEPSNEAFESKRRADEQARLDAEAASRSQRQKELEAQSRAAESKFAQQRRDLEHRADISESQRAFELEKLNRAHLIETLRQDLEIRKLQAEISKVEASAERDAEAIRRERQAIAEEMAQQKAGLDALAQELRDRIDAIPAPTLAQAAAGGGSGQGCAELHDRFDVPPCALDALTQGGPTAASHLVELLEGQMHARPNALRLRMAAAVSVRDTGARKMIHQIRIDDSLAMTVESAGTGYLSLLNIGTSERSPVFLQIPNRFVRASDCKIGVTQEPLAIPNPQWLPLRKHGYEYYESGPVGWERLAVIRTDKLLWTPERLAGLIPVEPCFYELDAKAYEELLDTLEALPADSWAAAIVGFQVLEK